MSKILQLGGFLGRLLGPLIKVGLTLIRNALKPLAKSVLIPLGLTAAASATDAAIQEKNFGSGMTDDINNFEKRMNGIMKIIKSLEESVLLIKEVRKTSKNEARKQRGGFLGMLFCTLGTSLLGNL